MYISLTMVDAAHISAPGDRSLALRLDPSAAIVTEYISFPEIPRLLYLPVYAGTFIIGRWCRDRLGGFVLGRCVTSIFLWRSVLEATSLDLEALR